MKQAVLGGRIGADAPAAAAPAATAARVRSDTSLGVRAEELSKSYGSFAALAGVSLDVRPAEFLTLLGPSGSGKTTLLNILAGFLRPDTGRLWFGGEDVTARPVHERGLGIVFQNYALFPHKTVFENIAFPLRVRKLGRPEIHRRVQEALDLVRLPQAGERRIESLSGGQRQRVALARAVVFRPRIVLMDEPLSALDKNLREEMQVEIRRLHETIGATTIYVTHDQREALTMSDRVVVMNQGRIEQCDTAAGIYERPASRFVASFIGETTLVPAVAAPPRRVRLPGGTLVDIDGPLPSGPGLALVLRAERLMLPGEYGDRANRLPAQVTRVIYQGDSLLVLAQIEGGQGVSVRKPLRGDGPAATLLAGQHVELGLDPSAAIIVSA